MNPSPAVHRFIRLLTASLLVTLAALILVAKYAYLQARQVEFLRDRAEAAEAHAMGADTKIQELQAQIEQARARRR